jgi:DNA-binding NtrC family response regulator
MIFPSAENQRAGRVIAMSAAVNLRRDSSWPTVLAATNDHEIRENMANLFQNYKVNVVWVSGLEETKRAVSAGNVAACFCGFWLVDGTYRDVVRHLKSQPVEVPVIIVCAPKCPDEYRDYLAALNIRAFDFICHPYRRTDLDRILDSAMRPKSKTIQMPSPLPTSVQASASLPSGLRPAG